MKLIIDIPDQMYLNAKADTLCGSDILVKAIKNGTPHETVTEFADRCHECGTKYGKLLKQDSCEDAISRQEVLDKIKEVCFSKEQEWVDFRVLQGSNGQRDLIIKFIEDLPSVQPKPKTGQWINIEDRTDWYDTSYKCSCCGREIITPYDFKNNLYSDYPYCHCGARMVEPQESEDKE